MTDMPMTAIAEPQVAALMQHLFADPSVGTFAVLDGASVPGLLKKFAEENPEQTCLYRGELKPDLAEAAPYLVRLVAGSPFARWVVEHGWDNHWGIFVRTAVDLPTLRRHFRNFLMVMSPEGKRLYFRFYDPRVFRVYLPTCNRDETKIIFGPVTSYLMSGSESGTLVAYSAPKGLPAGETVAL